MKKAIIVNQALGAIDGSKIGGLVVNAEVFFGDKEGNYIVVVREAVFDDAISKLKEYFGIENVRPYVCETGDSKKADIIHNLVGGLAADKGKKEKHFFV